MSGGLNLCRSTIPVSSTGHAWCDRLVEIVCYVCGKMPLLQLGRLNGFKDVDSRLRHSGMTD
jgi:hypothetical protein